MNVTAEIAFDTQVSKEGQRHVEGCYRLAGEDWRVFYFTSWYNGQRWKGPQEVIADQVWQSGICGVEVRCQDDLIINKGFVKKTLGNVLAVTDWLEVRGPDSLQLK